MFGRSQSEKRAAWNGTWNTNSSWFRVKERPFGLEHVTLSEREKMFYREHFKLFGSPVRFNGKSIKQRKPPSQGTLFTNVSCWCSVPHQQKGKHFCLGRCKYKQLKTMLVLMDNAKPVQMCGVGPFFSVTKWQMNDDEWKYCTYPVMVCGLWLRFIFIYHLLTVILWLWKRGLPWKFAQYMLFHFFYFLNCLCVCILF